ncbi:MAG: 4-hydroxythreonine-4-phosphate dehydrogenase PdxA [Gallionellales bacterium 35-53-114]|jgi:4-hydroxythreonine-4-phosphate dehydrogenase|nr:MAG: 4-hydroxythreonine-4-phosphate dehydrogenase PdxA [Gallionellales bacterium 35-53-114]OYZ62367.1 MAG: 4-hydroxythreonine-4-phosphate dehydrogenase PdxA [Gallionellales bacterium 24-53-125]OZB07407.1 MAG: 4-hydroxythreonine-4-phosphate dehydrogenase PdxA [Gallionellales bacterium 39-52-133]HQS59582.1 4-hydroxythreonine-4-phosphate dehydrogenase PdxA [Gallionellaceae bacterium]HQS75515.1 4-hydroxythreonine-4-phosphate dehydrogenase PdxA [Gallionellaceae bacterium]
MQQYTAPLAITAGEPAGIGADLCLQLAQQSHAYPFVVLCDKQLLRQRALQLKLAVQLHDYDAKDISTLPAGHLRVLHIPLAQPAQAGHLNPANSAYVLALLRRAVQGCQSGEFSAMVTAPVHKGVINDAGIPFTGHTEFLAELTHTPLVVMMLAGGGMRVALATTHLPLREVADAITSELLENILTIMRHDLQRRFGIAHPRILVAGLNPHAGEGGYLGREEIDIMIPVLNKLRAQGMKVSEPLPADTLFAKHRLAECDAVLAMYHDQGLPVLKHASFGTGVNITLGMPIIRTSVDHGTALDLAGTGHAEAGSLLEAMQVAVQMVECEKSSDALSQKAL